MADITLSSNKTPCNNKSVDGLFFICKADCEIEPISFSGISLLNWVQENYPQHTLTTTHNMLRGLEKGGYIRRSKTKSGEFFLTDDFLKTSNHKDIAKAFPSDTTETELKVLYKFLTRLRETEFNSLSKNKLTGAININRHYTKYYLTPSGQPRITTKIEEIDTKGAPAKNHSSYHSLATDTGAFIAECDPQSSPVNNYVKSFPGSRGTIKNEHLAPGPLSATLSRDYDMYIKNMTDTFIPQTESSSSRWIWNSEPTNKGLYDQIEQCLIGLALFEDPFRIGQY